MWQRIKRVVRHQWVDDAALRRAMPADMMKSLQDSITASEQQHSCEIQVYAEAGLPLSDLWRDEPTAVITRARALQLHRDRGRHRGAGGQVAP